MHPELEKLIDMVVADGQITEKERAVVIKKAIALDVDPDEAEIYLDGKLHQLNQANKQIVFPAPPLEKKSNKEGDLKKCPACGAPVESFNTKCKECGHEFRNVQANNSISSLFEKIQKVDEDSSNDKSGGLLSELFDSQKRKRVEQKISLISSFPIPNTREDILEFLVMAVPQSKVKSTSFFGKLTTPQVGSSQWMSDGPKWAWTEKCEQIIMKARFSMKDDKKTLEEIEYYAKQLNIK